MKVTTATKNSPDPRLDTLCGACGHRYFTHNPAELTPFGERLFKEKHLKCWYGMGVTNGQCKCKGFIPTNRKFKR